MHKVIVKDVEVDVSPRSSNESMNSGTVRVVTEADILGDPRLVAASAVVGQLYDFSNLPFIKDGSIEADVDGYNKVKENAEVNAEHVAANPPLLTSEAERVELGLEPKLKDAEVKP